MLILGQKACFLGPTIFEIQQPNWHYYIISYESLWFKFFCVNSLDFRSLKCTFCANFEGQALLFYFFFFGIGPWKSLFIYSSALSFSGRKKERGKSFAFDLLKKGHNHKLKTDFYEVAIPDRYSRVVRDFEREAKTRCNF